MRQIDVQGISAQFSNIVEGKQGIYEVDYTQSVKDLKFDGNQTGNIRKATDGNYYFYVNNGDNPLYYSAKLIITDENNDQ